MTRQGFSLTELLLALTISVYVLALSFSCLTTMSQVMRTGAQLSTATAAVVSLLPGVIQRHPQRNRSDLLSVSDRGDRTEVGLQVDQPGLGMLTAVVVSPSLPVLPPGAGGTAPSATGTLIRNLRVPPSARMLNGDRVGFVTTNGSCFHGVVASKAVTSGGVSFSIQALVNQSQTPPSTLVGRAGRALVLRLPTTDTRIP